jgi:hypothetical protein
MSRLASALLRLYPRGWRRRYGAEMAAMLEAEPLTLRTATDLVAGAIDARLNPHWMRGPAAASAKGTTMTTRMFRCAPAGVTGRDLRWRSAAWMIGGSLAFVLTSFLANVAWDDSSLSEALLLAAFPASLMMSSECTYLKPYSRAVRITLALGGALLIVVITWASMLVKGL